MIEACRKRRPRSSIKIFLTSLAIFDDIGAVLIIALFYTDKISMIALVVVAVCVLVLALLNRQGNESKSMFVAVGIALGLFVGKQVGIFGLCWLAIKLKFTKLPNSMSWGSLYGTAVLCGVGFTTSLFIGSLAFEETGVNLLFDERLGIILGLLASGILGYVVLRQSLPPEPSMTDLKVWINLRSGKTV